MGRQNDYFLTTKMRLYFRQNLFIFMQCKPFRNLDQLYIQDSSTFDMMVTGINNSDFVFLCNGYLWV